MTESLFNQKRNVVYLTDTLSSADNLTGLLLQEPEMKVEFEGNVSITSVLANGATQDGVRGK